jgi:hypothetical protein
MMHGWKKVILVCGSLFTILTFIFSGCQASPAATPAGSEKVITIGNLGPLTGPLRALGQASIGVNDYITYLNETQGGVKYKDPKTGKETIVKLKGLMGDHAYDGVKSLSLYERYKAAGMDLVMCCGSTPAEAIFSLCARDHIPGFVVTSGVSPSLYDVPEPYLAMNGAAQPIYTSLLAAWYADEWKKSGKTDKFKIGLICADVPTRRLCDNDEAYGFKTYVRDVLGAELVSIAYIPQAPIDVKAELSRMVDGGANLVMVDHWGTSAFRVLMNDAMTLGMHKKGVTLNLEWIPPDVMLNEPAIFDEYNKSARVEALSEGWCGNESAEVQAKYPGLKLAFDVCAKYHNGAIPEKNGGWFYVYGVKEMMLGEQVIKQTLERTGWDGFSREELRKTIFNMKTIDSGGLCPTFTPDPKVLMTLPSMAVTDIKNGHMITDLNKRPFLASNTGNKIWPDYNLKMSANWLPFVWTPPDFPKALMGK